MPRCDRPHIHRTFALALLLAIMASLGAPAAKAGCGTARRDIAVGGTVGFADMANPKNTEALRATCQAGLYVHDYIWGRLPDDRTREAILKAFEDTGPPTIEIGATHAPDIFWNKYYTGRYIRFGIKAEQTHVNGVGRLSVGQWKAFVDGGRALGVKIVSPVFSPNTGQWKNAPFADHKWDDLRSEAEYGGGITIDSPPMFFLSQPAGYQKFVEDEIRWARGKHIQATFIISPNNSGKKFQTDTARLLGRLEADHALPDFYIVENYRPLPVDPAYLNAIGNEKNPISINGVALWLARHHERTP